MERGSDKHGPQLDEEMKREVESIQHGAPVPSRVEDFREVEPVDFDEEQGPADDDSVESDAGPVEPDE